jgi:PAS domain S-box-containing protein
VEIVGLCSKSPLWCLCLIVWITILRAWRFQGTEQLNQRLNQNPSSVNSVSNLTAQQTPTKVQNLYQSLFSNMNDGFAYCKLELDTQGKPNDYVFQDVNKAYKRLIGLHNHQIIGKKASELIPILKEEFFECVKTCSEVALTGRTLIFEKRCSNSDKWFSVNAYSPEEGYFAMVIKDVSARRKTEQALRQSEKRYRKLAESVTDPFFALDSSLKFNYWNKASEKIMGINMQDAMGKGFFDVFGKNKATSKAVKIYLNVMNTKKTRIMVDKLPKMVNEDEIFEIQVYPTGNGISVLAKNITERRKLQAAMEDYTKHLEEIVKARTEKLKSVERLATIGETAGMVGHDIRNPLQSIIGELYLAKDEVDVFPACAAKQNLMESISSIEEQTMYINKIVTDLQDYAKALTPSYQEIDLEETVQAIIAALDIPDNIALSYWFEKPFSTIKTDPSFMKRILTNLSLNGVQAMLEKNSGELSINAFQRPKSVLIAVSDTGPGIPNEVKEKIFKPLFTTKSKGQGFGLPVVKKLVEALGGEISFETKLGRGTTFIFELPLNEAV